MSQLTITLSDTEYQKLADRAAEQRRTPELQAEVLVLEGLKIALKAPPKEERLPKVMTHTFSTVNKDA